MDPGAEMTVSTAFAVPHFLDVNVWADPTGEGQAGSGASHHTAAASSIDAAVSDRINIDRYDLLCIAPRAFSHPKIVRRGGT